MYPQDALEDRTIPDLRIRTLNQRSANEGGEYVLYWMVANRRTHWNYSLQRAAEWAADLNKPLLVLEALRCDYQWASDRLHHFVIGGMADNATALEDRPATYYPYLEDRPEAGSGLLAALAERACLVVSDDFPCFFLPRMLKLVAKRIDVRFEAVDSNGLLPMRAADKVYTRAFDLRRFLQKTLPNHFAELPQPDPLANQRSVAEYQIPNDVTDRWPIADVAKLAANPELLSEFPIDHQVPIVTEISGGELAAVEQLGEFLEAKLDIYAEQRNQPEQDASSGLSPYLHFGHLSVHQVFAELMQQIGWNPQKVSPKVNGARSGWWGTEETVESFLDELITWRELGYNMCWQAPDYARYGSLPDWAQQTLADHASDERDHVYTLEEFERAKTHDELWNAAQRQLLLEGRIHNYLRMLWGKKILEWTESPQQALAVMIELNNKYALDGRNPNSYSGIFWVLGRYDRAWGPERPVYGKIRYMSSDNTARKVKVKQYVQRFSANSIKQRQLF